jgi:lipopolysaccharide export system protein LptA
MHSGFRLMLRAALVIVVLACAVLVVHETSGRGRGTAPPPVSPPSQPETPPVGPSPQPVTAEAPTGAAAEASAPPEAGAPPGRTPSDVQSTLYQFESRLRDAERKREEAVVRGARADQHGKTYDIADPDVLVNLPPRNGEGLDVRVGHVRLLAKRAELDEQSGVVRLFDDVSVQGEDFQAFADRVTYRALQRTLASDGPVRIQRDKPATDGSRQPEMVVTGQGLAADWAQMQMTILRNVEARLYGVSDEFLAAEPVRTRDGSAVRDVVITSDGKMVYDNLSRKVRFYDNVHTVSGEEHLNCDELTVLLRQTGAKGTLEVSDIVATGKVKLTYTDMLGRGERFEWHNVTQTGVLSGQPALLSTPEFELGGNEVSFYKVTDRVHAEGPGSLVWKASRPDTAKPAQQDRPEGWGVSPFSAEGNSPVHVQWTGSMTYHVDARKASFDRQVVAKQGTSTLACDRLVFNLEPDGRRVAGLEADGNVAIREVLAEGGRDILCGHLTWNAAQDLVEIVAAEGQTVSVASGGKSITAGRVVLDNQHETLECPVPGKLTFQPGKGSGGSEPAPPVEVAWQKAMHFRQGGEPVAIFRGGAVAVRGDQRIGGETLRVDFDPDMNPTRIVASQDALLDIQTPQKEQPAGGAPEAAEREKAGALTVPGMQGGQWRLTSEEIVITTPDQHIQAPAAGTLTIIEAQTPTGTVVWQDSADVSLIQRVANFRGHVQADVPEALLNGDSLKLDFDEARNLRHMWAEGTVYFAGKQKGAWQLNADSAEAVFAAESEMKQVIARGNVQVQDDLRTLTTRLLQLFFERVPTEGQSALDRAVADGDVLVKYRSEDRTEAGGDRLEWNRQTDLYVLTGKPEAYLQRGRLKSLAEKILLDRPTGRLEMPPGARPVRTVFMPEIE